MAQLGAGMAGCKRIRSYPKIFTMERRASCSSEGNKKSSSGSKICSHEWPVWCDDRVVFEVHWREIINRRSVMDGEDPLRCLYVLGMELLRVGLKT